MAEQELPNTVCGCGAQFDSFKEWTVHISAENHTNGAPNVPAPSRADDAADEAAELERRHGLVSGWDGFMDDPVTKVARARALGDRLRASSEHRVQECGAFIGEALDGTVDEAKLVAFLRGRP